MKVSWKKRKDPNPNVVNALHSGFRRGSGVEPSSVRILKKSPVTTPTEESDSTKALSKISNGNITNRKSPEINYTLGEGRFGGK